MPPRLGVPYALLLAMLLASCGAVSVEHEGIPRTARDDHEVHADVDARGGTLTLSSGLRVEIAEELLARSTRVVLRQLGDAAVVPSAARTIGSAFVVEPAMVPESCDGLCVFMISIPAELVPAGVTESCLALAQEDADGESTDPDAEAWTIVPAHVDGNRLEADVAYVLGRRLQFVAVPPGE